ncbi:L-threonine 3-dehydrogenase [Akkermansiaceae bacterium]|nr:L-threonine 3-dehydrogenase [Akkermansiaceae bacterium]MDA7933173.1 L-threonine 3-dehydrogenase [bacterium]MDA7894357.1 L-threonine 3-dehydrogenase [Akkermansiaceae bacterium]MDA7908625.1 L-threonine 3-dehydrogenase [Akkermansiaceae bacterium]MDB4388865.1 L-threonine 3-dehydrogenase [Akkermansiaceae bacterium]
MKALVKSEAASGLTLTEVPQPVPGPRQVLIQIDRTGICGTDLHIYNWDSWAQKTIPVPLVIGHEFVGRIVEIGNDVDFFKIGDLVSGEGHLICGRCRNCLAGRRHYCKDTLGVGVNSPGAFAEFMVLPATNVWKLAPEVSKDSAAIFDPFGNATHTALTFPLLGEDVLITGAGPIGCMAAGIARHAGARHVVVTDLNPKRLALAKKLGATRTVNVTNEKISKVQTDLRMTEGFDVGLEMSGNKEAFNDLIANMRHSGQIALLGIPEHGISIDWNQVIFNSLTIQGIYGRKMYDTWYQMTSMIQSGLEIESVITHRFEYTDFEKGFAAMNEGSCGKVLLHWADLG